MSLDENNVLDPSVVLYSNADVKNSLIEKKSFVGENSRVRGSKLFGYNKIDRNNLILNCQIGRGTYTGPFDMIFNSIIGSFSSISYGVTIGPPEHNYKLLSAHPFVYDSYYDIFEKEQCLRNDKFDKTLEIGNDVWIGANSTILRGVKIGNGAVVGANSLVKHDVPPYAIVVGSPAKIIKYRFDEETIDLLNRIAWWNWPLEKIKENRELFTSEINQETKEKLKDLL